MAMRSLRRPGNLRIIDAWIRKWIAWRRRFGTTIT
jgi:hypothetical protein